MADATGDPVVFNARFLSALTFDRQYRIYFRDGAFYLIRIGGQGNMNQLAMQFGLLGALISGFSKRGAKTTAAIAELDARHPETLLDDHKHNFSFTPADVVTSTLGPPTLFGQHGPHVGRWTVTLRDGKKKTYEFEDLDHMHTAARHLPTILGPQIAVTAQWDEDKQRYRKA